MCSSKLHKMFSQTPRVQWFPIFLPAYFFALWPFQPKTQIILFRDVYVPEDIKVLIHPNANIIKKIRKINSLLYSRSVFFLLSYPANHFLTPLVTSWSPPQTDPQVGNHYSIVIQSCRKLWVHLLRLINIEILVATIIQT